MKLLYVVIVNNGEVAHCCSSDDLDEYVRCFLNSGGRAENLTIKVRI